MTSSNSHIYLGTKGKVKHYELRHEDEKLLSHDDTVIVGSTPAWFVHDAQSQRLFAADSKGARLHVFQLDPKSGRLAVENAFGFLPHVVHLTLEKTEDAYRLFAASYDNSEFAAYRLPLTADSVSQDFHEKLGAAVHTHSSALDQKRGLVIAANKHGNSLIVYAREYRTLRKLSQVPLEDARLLVYDDKFDLLYCATEADEGSSFVRIFQVNREGDRVEFKELDSFKMAQRGSDLKIDHTHRMLATTVREAGKEGVWLLPLDQTGRFDLSRKRVFLPIKEKEARSMDFAGNGRFVVVTCNDAQNKFDVIIYRLAYSKTSDILDTQVIHQIKAGPGKFPGHFVFESEPST